jgi:hypothetical protein
MLAAADDVCAASPASPVLRKEESRGWQHRGFLGEILVECLEEHSTFSWSAQEYIQFWDVAR